LLALEGFVDVERERVRLRGKAQKAAQEAERARKKLDNPGFLAKAPAAVVEEERGRLARAGDLVTELGRQYRERIGEELSTGEQRPERPAPTSSLRCSAHAGADRVRRLSEALGSPHWPAGPSRGGRRPPPPGSFLHPGEGQGGDLRLSLFVSLAERQLVDGVPSTDEEFYELVAGQTGGRGIDAFAEGGVTSRGADRGLLTFAEQRRRGGHEAGLGGRWDATSIISSRCRC
jgi:hypothetical protein